MGERVKCLAPAALVTVLDAAVAMNYGGMVWKVLSGIIWTKLLLLLLASVWATTLLHVWFHACSRLRHEIDRGLHRWVLEIDGRRGDVIANRQNAEDRLDRPGGAQQMPCRRLG